MSSSQATILYPNNTLKIPLNINDRVAVTYSSPWPLTNLTLLCRAATSSLYDFFNAPDNPLTSTGTYLMQSFSSMNLNVQNFPADCVFRLTQYRNNAVINDGASFQLVSTTGTARTFAISSTAGLALSASSSAASSSASSASAIMTGIATTLSADSITAFSSTSISPIQTSSSSSSSLSAPAPAEGGGGMSPPARIGLIVGIVVALIILVTAVILTFRICRSRWRRKQGHQMLLNNGRRNEKPELYGSEFSASSNLRYGDGGATMVDSYGVTGWASSHRETVPEKHGTPVVEKEGSQVATELDAPDRRGGRQSRRIELP